MAESIVETFTLLYFRGNAQYARASTFDHLNFAPNFFLPLLSNFFTFFKSINNKGRLNSSWIIPFSYFLPEKQTTKDGKMKRYKLNEEKYSRASPFSSLNIFYVRYT